MFEFFLFFSGSDGMGLRVIGWGVPDFSKDRDVFLLQGLGSISRTTKQVLLDTRSKMWLLRSETVWLDSSVRISSDISQEFDLDS